MKPTYNPPYGRFGAAIRTTAAPSIPDAEPVFQIGDMVMHPSEGVCAIEDLHLMDLCGAQRTYYILKPAMQKSSLTVYLPVVRGNTVLRRLLSHQDILGIIQRARECSSLWIADSKQRKEAFTRILSQGDYVKIIRMMQDIYETRICRMQQGKKACAADEAILAEAERLLHQEFSCVLHMTPEATAAFVHRELGIE